MGRVIRLTELTAADIAAWSSLAARAAEPNPFVEPDFLLPLCAASEASDDLSIAVVESKDRWTAALVFSLERASVLRMPLPHVSANGPFMANELGRQHPLLDAQDPGGALVDLLACLKEYGLPGTIDFGYIPADGAIHEGLASMASRGGLYTQIRDRDDRAYLAAGPATEFPGSTTPDQWLLPHVAPRQRKALRARARRLETLAGGPLTYHDCSDDDGALGALLRLQAAGWKGDSARGGSALATRPGASEAVFDVAGRLRRDDRWRLDLVRAGEEVVFGAIRIRARPGGWFGFIDAYDERFAACSPGQIGRLAELAAHRAKAPDETFDPCMSGHYVDATRLYPDRRTNAYTVLAYGGVAERLRLASVPVVQRAVSAVRAGIRASKAKVAAGRCMLALFLDGLLPDAAIVTIL